MSNLDREKVAFTVGISHGLHVQALKEFGLVHEAVEGEGPAITDGL